MVSVDPDPTVFVTGVRTAPTPSPSIIRSGRETYPDPWLSTITSSIAPFLIIGFNCASEPTPSVTTGSLSRLMTSDTPYPTPLAVRSTDVTWPLKIGWIDASKEVLPVDANPTFPTKETLMSG